MFTNIEGEARNIFQNVLTILSKSAFFDLFFFQNFSSLGEIGKSI